MNAAAQNSMLRPPASVGRITAFLGEVTSRLFNRSSLLEQETVGESLRRHEIAGSDVQGFLNWLHTDQRELPAKVKEVEPPAKDLAKPKPLESDERNQFDEAPEAQDDDKPGLELSHILRTAERIRGPRKARTEISVPPVSRAEQFLAQNNRGFTARLIGLATPEGDGTSLSLPGSPVRETLIEQQIIEREGATQPGRQGRPLTYGLAAQAASQKLIDDRTASPATWNEPIRTDILPKFAPSELPLFMPPQRTAPQGEDGVAAEKVADPLYGQLTLIAPPMSVVAPGSASALKLDWRDMAKGSQQLDFESLATLATTLPPGSKAMYPAMDPRQLTRGAVNLRLTPNLISGLAQMGFGAGKMVDPHRSVKMVNDYYGGTPPVRRLPAALTPVSRPGRRRGSQNPDLLPQGGIGQPADEPGRRMRFIDYLGLPIYLSETFSTTPDLEQEIHSRISTEFMPRAPLLSPLAFFNLRNRMLPGFHGIDAKPELGSWRRSSPDYERAGSALASMLNKGIRSGTMGDGMTHAAAPIARTAAPKIPILPGPVKNNLAMSALPMLAGSALASPSPIGGVGQSATAPRPPSVGSAPQGAGSIPRFIRPSGRAAPISGTMPAISMGATEADTPPKSQGATGMQPAHLSSPTTIRPHITIAPEKPAGKPLGAVAPKQESKTSQPIAHPVVVEGPKAPPKTAPPMPLTPRPAQTPAPKPQSQEAAPQPKLAEMPADRTTSSGLKPPQMLVAPHKPIPGPSIGTDPLAVQTGETPRGGASTDGGSSKAAEAAEKKDTGLPGSEINLLANEVWSLLKRRIAFEAQRAGHK
ncbi:MAG: hypothetical protein IT203_04700 [Fimbriimonadaceae bacterium]|nr:hypothetical protein [Fimbriimonadaceae bacterium]